MIELIDVKKKFENSNNFITNGVSFFVPTGKTLCIIGLSGEGKSVLLKQIGGLIKSTSGQIFIEGLDITSLSEDEREKIYEKCGYVFQFAALLDSLNIYENMALPLIEKEKKENEIEKSIKKVLHEVNLSEDILFKYPSEISGGMRKRVGLARTLLMNPKIILYDEPTSGLDPINTTIIHKLIKETQEKNNVTSIVISHDITIFDYVDLVAFLYQGKIEYIGDAKTIWKCEDSFVKQFIRGLLEGPII